MNPKPITPWYTQVFAPGLRLLGALIQLILTIIVCIPVVLVWLMMMLGPFALFAWLLLSICCRK